MKRLTVAVLIMLLIPSVVYSQNVITLNPPVINGKQLAPEEYTYNVQKLVSFGGFWTSVNVEVIDGKFLIEDDARYSVSVNGSSDTFVPDIGNDNVIDLKEVIWILKMLSGVDN